MSLLSGKGQVPSGSSVPVGTNLAMPPDLSLAQPTATSDAYQPNGYVAPPPQPMQAETMPAQTMAQKPTKMASAAPSSNMYGDVAAPAAPAATGDVFDQAGISKTKPDGSKKTAQELNQELSAYYMAKKKSQNPSYGSVGNIGAIFQ